MLFLIRGSEEFNTKKSLLQFHRSNPELLRIQRSLKTGWSVFLLCCWWSGVLGWTVSLRLFCFFVFLCVCVLFLPFISSSCLHDDFYLIFFHILHRITLEIMTLQPKCEDVETAEGVAITVTGVAQVNHHTFPRNARSDSTNPLPIPSFLWQNSH